MAYWWVNQKHTHRQEIGGQYLWSPKTKRSKEGAPINNKSYQFMTQVRPGDIVFCYWEKMIRAVGVATGSSMDAPRPPEFLVTPHDWSDDGWRLPVEFVMLSNPLDPKAHREIVAKHLPTEKGAYSPLHPETLAGQQFLYLAAVPVQLGDALLSLLGELPQVQRRARRVTASFESPEVAAAEAAVAVATGRQGQEQGRRQSPEERVAIEIYSMDQATKYLESPEGGGWNVKNVCRGNPFDLFCWRGDERLRVEVKGTSSSGEAVILTWGEVEHNRRWANEVALVVVHGVKVTIEAGKVRVSGGTLTMRFPWDTRDEDLEVLAYKYHLPRTPPLAELHLG